MAEVIIWILRILLGFSFLFCLLVAIGAILGFIDLISKEYNPGIYWYIFRRKEHRLFNLLEYDVNSELVNFERVTEHILQMEWREEFVVYVEGTKCAIFQNKKCVASSDHPKSKRIGKAIIQKYFTKSIEPETARLANSKGVKVLYDDKELCSQEYLQEMLKKEYKIYVSVYYLSPNWRHTLLKDYTKEPSFETYEEALEDGLRKALGTIKREDDFLF